MNYTLGTGYYPHPGARGMRQLWEQNVLRHAEPAPVNVVTLAVDCALEPGLPDAWIRLSGNLGHVGDLLHGRKPHHICGWSAGMMALALIAYNNETDFVYLEEDALAFGPWVRQMYAELGPRQFAFGRKMKSPPWMACSQSLFIIRHSWILTFIHAYISLGTDNDRENLPETKFERIEQVFPFQCCRLSFVRDRERPLPYDSPVWSAQKFTPEELEELRQRGLV